ncbi:cytochrome P450 [Rhizocola hellebori]|uniref:Cytochrome P450 n=1 Tax=Rhizocola hellebori TaxID=1392758 RepID=A0A8J3VJZ0_9ACTN|nr:cytochrome P450 [Rhizocola hellebori]GIH08473.1 cytochrome P450 [Rhizocola hellebori]
MTLDVEFNPFHGAQLAEPYPVYARARREEPVFFSQVLQMWYVTRYDDIVAVTQDPVRFSSADSVDAPQERTAETLQAIKESWLSYSSLTNNDPPSHTAVRRVVTKAFHQRSRAELESRVRAIATGLLEGFAADGRAEFVGQFGLPLPLRVILNLLGAPESDQAELKQWSDDWISLVLDPLSPQQQAHTVTRLQECGRYWSDLIEARRAHPRDDIISDMVAASAQEPEPIPLAQLVNACATLTLAGHETTANLLGNCLRQLLTQPDQWRLVCDDPANIPRAIEETLRADTSVHALMRTTTEPVTLGGIALPRGARLALLFASANHDQTYYPDAARFDLRREQTKAHLAFGHGIHYCLGAALARLEGQVTLELLTSRLPGLRLSAGQELAWIANPIHRGLRQLHIEWDTLRSKDGSHE